MLAIPLLIACLLYADGDKGMMRAILLFSCVETFLHYIGGHHR
jgi:hypothetical protein